MLSNTCIVTFKLPSYRIHLSKLAAAFRRDNCEIAFNKHEFSAIAMYRWASMRVNILYSFNVVVIGSNKIVATNKNIKFFKTIYKR